MHALPAVAARVPARLLPGHAARRLASRALTQGSVLGLCAAASVLTPRHARAVVSAAGRSPTVMAAATDKKTVLVAAAALLDDRGRVLLAQRPAGKSMAGLWEFPGGKVDPGETLEVALARELAEELGVTVAPSDLTPLTFASHAYDDFYLVMPLFAVTRWTGTPSGKEGQAVQWTPVGKLRGVAMPPADAPLLPAVERAATEYATPSAADMA